MAETTVDFGREAFNACQRGTANEQQQQSVACKIILLSRDAAWGRNAISFIRERGLESEFSDFCGGWPVTTMLGGA